MGIATGTLLGPYRVADNNQWRVVRLIDRPHRPSKSNGDLGSIRSKVAELTYDVAAGGLLIRNLYERGPVLCLGKSASVCLLTELKNSSSVCCFDASPSASKLSSSSGVPAKPGTVRCSTAVKAASTTSSTD